MPGFRKKHSSHYAANLATLAIAAGIFAARCDVALAQTAPAPVCLAKTDATGGRMRFVVLEADAATFEAAGFQRFACPNITQLIVDGQHDRCVRLRTSSSEVVEIVQSLYGMTIDEMCVATDAWVNARQQGQL